MNLPSDSTQLDERTLRRARAALDWDQTRVGEDKRRVLERLLLLEAAIAAGRPGEINALCAEIESPGPTRPLTRGGRITSSPEGDDATMHVAEILVLRNKLIGRLDVALEDVEVRGRD